MNAVRSGASRECVPKLELGHEEWINQGFYRRKGRSKSADKIFFNTVAVPPDYPEEPCSVCFVVPFQKS